MYIYQFLRSYFCIFWFFRQIWTWNLYDWIGFLYKHLWTTNFKAKKILNKFCRIIKLLRKFRSSTDQCANRGSSGKAYRIVMIHYGQYCFIIPQKLWNLHQRRPSIKDIGNKAGVSDKICQWIGLKNCQHGRGRYISKIQQKLLSSFVVSPKSLMMRHIPNILAYLADPVVAKIYDIYGSTHSSHFVTMSDIRLFVIS